MADLRFGFLLGLMFWAHTTSAELSVESLNMLSHIKYRFATTLVTSTVVNRDEAGSKEAFFEVILPEEAFIANFSMTVDGEVYPGRVEEKEKAEAEYEEAKSQGQSAGYIKTTARHSNKFDVSVNLKAGSEVSFNLTYQQLLPRCHGLYEHKMHINSKQPVPDLVVEVYIEELREITELTSEFIEGENSIPKVDEFVVLEESSPTTRYIRFQPSLDKQGTAGVDRRFVVKYDVERSSPGGEMMVMDGYFLHFFAPENAGELKAIPKDIVFILDVSGSMSGSRIQQLKEAMSTIVQELSPEDSFNILTFSSQVQRWKDKLVPATESYTNEALSYVSRLRARGSTNINSALLDGVRFHHEHGNSKHVPLIFFLTDGEPTVGVRSASDIADNVQRENEDVASVFGLAFGEGADFNFLKVISVQNNGFARKIYEAADASKQVKGFYDEISTTMLRNLTVTYVNGSVLTDTLTPTFFRNVFDGTDIVIAGRYTTPKDNNETNIIIAKLSSNNGEGINPLTGEPWICVYPPPRPRPVPIKYTQQPVDMASVIEKSWAYITIKNLLKEKKKSTYKSGNSRIDNQILKMSLKYNFVTPLTSMVATKPDQTKTKARVEGDEFDLEDQPSSQSRYSSKSIAHSPLRTGASGPNIYRSPGVYGFAGGAGGGARRSSRKRKGKKRMHSNSYYGRAVGKQHIRVPNSPKIGQVQSSYQFQLPGGNAGPGSSFDTSYHMYHQTTPPPLPPYSRSYPASYPTSDSHPQTVTKHLVPTTVNPVQTSDSHPPTVTKRLVPTTVNPVQTSDSHPPTVSKRLVPTTVNPVQTSDALSPLATKRLVPTTVNPVQPSVTPVQQVSRGPKPSKKPYKPARKCRIVKSVFGFGVNNGGQVSCVRVKKANAGVYQLFPKNKEISVQVEYETGYRKPRVKGISIWSEGITYNLNMNPQNMTAGVLKYSSKHGNISVHKEVNCGGRRGWVAYFVMVELHDNRNSYDAASSPSVAPAETGYSVCNVDNVLSPITKRDVRRKIHRLKKKIKKAKKKTRKSNLFRTLCAGSYTKVYLNPSSSRYIGGVRPTLVPSAVHKNFNI